MKERQGRTAGARRDWLPVTANMVVRIVGSLIFLALSWYSFRYTQYMIVGGPEKPINVRDSAVSNILATLAAVALLLLLRALKTGIPDRIRQTVMRLSVAVSVLWTGAWGFWWITVIDRKPAGDQAFVYGAASYFLEGEFGFLDKGAYCGLCPHQLPQIALVELIFLVVGTYNYFACQVIITALAAGIVWLGARFLWEITQDCVSVVFYSILMLGCMPLIFYSGWIYGDIPSIFFMLLAAWLLLRYEKTNRLRWLIGIVPSVTLAVMVRMNSVIFLIALGIAGVVYLWVKRDRKFLAVLAVSLILPFVVIAGINKMYELRSGKPHAEGMASWSYIAMGMQEVYGKYGWYTLYCAEVFNSVGFDPVKAAEISKQDARERLEVFRQDPAYAWTFYREKVLSQWNEPLYQSLYFGNSFWPPETEEQKAFIAKLNETAFERLLQISDRIQAVIYVGVLCYFLLAVKKRSGILQHLLAITIIGGFFFSIIWEAKSRYVMPYYVTMFPIAVIGYQELITLAKGLSGFTAVSGRKRNTR